MRAWKEQLKLVASSPDLLNVAAQNPAVGAHVESLLVGLLCSHETSLGTSPPSSIAPLFVRRAEEFMAANLAGPMQLQDIARAAGVPVRTLTEGFLRFRNVSPISLMRQMRLDRAAAVRHRPFGDASIGDIRQTESPRDALHLSRCVGTRLSDL
jgi:hypothetical protein